MCILQVQWPSEQLLHAIIVQLLNICFYFFFRVFHSFHLERVIKIPVHQHCRVAAEGRGVGKEGLRVWGHTLRAQGAPFFFPSAFKLKI